MHPSIRLVAMPEETNFAPLGVLGYCLMRTSFLAPVLQAVKVPLKTVAHAPAAKVLDVLVSILAGCRAISQINTRLRPDLALACAWGRPQFAAQATVARTLDSFTDDHVAQLRYGCDRLFRRESQTLRHPFAEQWLWLDIDLTPLPASKYAEASTKGKISPKKTCMFAKWRACMAAVPRNALLPALPWQPGQCPDLRPGVRRARVLSWIVPRAEGADDFRLG